MNLIVATDKNWGIGKNNDLLFHIPKDMKFFRETTTGKTVIMGRKTLESFPNKKPLPNRRNIVLTRNKDYVLEGAEVIYDISELNVEADAFVIGGSEIYKLLLPLCHTAYITKVDADGGADKFFPNLDKDEEWELIEQSEPVTDNGYTITFCKFQRKDRTCPQT
ncbi:MAG: dihydrofolate reductase [Clostridia bacterium]|nr:dihydrofolate reductase [Clostridia bacterium]